MAISAGEGLASLEAAMNSIDVNSLNGDYDTDKGGWFGKGEGFGGVSAASLVGITPQLVSDFGSALDAYKSEVTSKLKTMQAKDATVGFKGEAINNAIKNFVARVIEVSNEYLEQLDTVHREMVTQVQTNYETQDTGINSSVVSDGSSVSGQKFNGGGVS